MGMLWMFFFFHAMLHNYERSFWCLCWYCIVCVNELNKMGHAPFSKRWAVIGCNPRGALGEREFRSHFGDQMKSSFILPSLLTPTIVLLNCSLIPNPWTTKPWVGGWVMGSVTLVPTEKEKHQSWTDKFLRGSIW